MLRSPGFLSSSGIDKNSLLAYWRFEDNVLDAHGSNNLTASGSPTYTSDGKVDKAISFVNASTQYAYIVDSDCNLSFGDEDFTIGGWFLLDNKTTSQALIAKYDATNNDREYELYYNQPSDRFIFVTAGGTGAASDATTVTANNLGSPSLATWYFILGWHDAVNNEIAIQVNNGTADTNAHTIGCNDNISRFYIGGDDDATPGNLLDGDADEVMVWGRLLTAAEKTWLYNSGSGRGYSEL